MLACARRKQLHVSLTVCIPATINMTERTEKLDVSCPAFSGNNYPLVRVRLIETDRLHSRAYFTASIYARYLAIRNEYEIDPPAHDHAPFKTQIFPRSEKYVEFMERGCAAAGEDFGLL